MSFETKWEFGLAVGFDEERGIAFFLLVLRGCMSKYGFNQEFRPGICQVRSFFTHGILLSEQQSLKDSLTSISQSIQSRCLHYRSHNSLFTEITQEILQR
jgi:hypothetical protein